MLSIPRWSECWYLRPACPMPERIILCKCQVSLLLMGPQINTWLRGITAQTECVEETWLSCALFVLCLHCPVHSYLLTLRTCSGAALGPVSHCLLHNSLWSSDSRPQCCRWHHAPVQTEREGLSEFLLRRQDLTRQSVARKTRFPCFVCFVLFLFCFVFLLQKRWL